MFYYVYFLRSLEEAKLYIGSTDGLKKRLKDHNQGKVKSTKAFKPWEIVYYEAHKNKTLALKAELFYKTSQGRRQIKKKLGLE